ncbi:transposase family protein [Nitratidesulfovibrio vulgaris]|nr:transposase family protein [Nitratidesulfovibrio vulgaris]WCB48014.1 transposase family protein [Nitratidesulfovibrio vulgaris]
MDIRVEHSPRVRSACPICGRNLTCRDHAEPRTWRHLDTCQFKTFLSARIPRVDCPEHGVVQVKVPWAESKGRFTLLMERLVIDVLTECTTVTESPTHPVHHLGRSLGRHGAGSTPGQGT